MQAGNNQQVIYPELLEQIPQLFLHATFVGNSYRPQHGDRIWTQRQASEVFTDGLPGSVVCVLDPASGAQSLRALFSDAAYRIQSSLCVPGLHVECTGAGNSPGPF